MWQKEQIVSEFQRCGKRITQQRLVIFDVLLEGRWNSCKEVYCEAAKRDPSIGMATVYRTMSTLEEIGVLNKGYQYLPPQPPREEAVSCQQHSCV